MRIPARAIAGMVKTVAAEAGKPRAFLGGHSAGRVAMELGVEALAQHASKPRSPAKPHVSARSAQHSRSAAAARPDAAAIHHQVAERAASNGLYGESDEAETADAASDVIVSAG